MLLWAGIKCDIAKWVYQPFVFKELVKLGSNVI